MPPWVSMSNRYYVVVGGMYYGTCGDASQPADMFVFDIVPGSAGP